MKKYVLIAFLFFTVFFATAQEKYSINGQTIELKTAVQGELDLLWNIIDKRYHYYIKAADNDVIELTNSKNDDNSYNEEYKSTLKTLTNNTIDLSNVDFSLASLARAIEAYNLKSNPDYVSIHSKLDASWRLGIFGGITNSPFVGNPNNEKAAVFGAEIEMLVGKNKNHSGYLQLRHVSEKEAFKYKTTELSLGYRYRFINSDLFSVYGDVKFATLNFTKASVTYEDENATLDTEEIKDTAFDLPVIFGVGADVKISPAIYATVSYNQLFSVFLKNQGNFPVDVTAGLKFKFN